MSDWVEEMTPDEREEWNEFVRHFRIEALEKIASSDMFFSVFSEDDFDVKFCVELGAAIMLDKPIIVMAPIGAVLPEKLIAIADAIVFADIDTEEGQHEIAKTIADVGRLLADE